MADLKNLARESALNDIIIRQYRHPKDLEQIRRIFVDATMTGGASPYLKGMTYLELPRHFTYYAITVVIYLATLASSPIMNHAVLPPWVTQTRLRWLVLLLCSMFLIGWCHRWYQRRAIARFFNVFLMEGLNGELADIVTNFSLQVLQNGDCITTGPGGFWVAEYAGEVVGFVGLNKNMRADPTIGDVRRLAVAPDHQGKGVAEKLMDALAVHARLHNIQALELTTSDYNISAIRFYQRIGYRQVGRVLYHGFLILVLKRTIGGANGDESG